MTREETQRILAAIHTAYSEKLTPVPTSELVNLWWKLLQDLEFKHVQTVILSWISTEKYPPAIADIREKFSEIEMPADEAWRTVMDAVRKFGFYGETKAIDSLPEDVRETVKTLGWKEFCHTPESDIRILYAQFRDAHNAKQKRKKKLSQLSPVVRERLTEMLEPSKLKQIGDGL